MKDTCRLCRQLLPPRHRKYCESCSPRASLLWKQQERRASRGSPYWLDHWLKATGDLSTARRAYNAYMRDYMRAYRVRQRARRRERDHPQVTGEAKSVA
ncbi:MAG: hypothetical protein ACREQ3_26850, partial [Candidatus Binatia bacterium]